MSDPEGRREPGTGVSPVARAADEREEKTEIQDEITYFQLRKKLVHYATKVSMSPLTLAKGLKPLCELHYIGRHRSPKQNLTLPEEGEVMSPHESCATESDSQNSNEIM